MLKTCMNTTDTSSIGTQTDHIPTDCQNDVENVYEYYGHVVDRNTNGPHTDRFAAVSRKQNEYLGEYEQIVTDETSPSEEINKNHRVVILSDSHGRECSKFITDKVGNNTSGFGIVQSNPKISEVGRDIKETIQDLGRNDYLILIMVPMIL
ncbi:hypothetical protein QE152_g30468 [Popillia japonica]|uniref:Uncharacterized protein n=1 Tax=Popillia japonica TaxID=7064 RepID=A0AAW1JFM0_POPJA